MIDISALIFLFFSQSLYGRARRVRDTQHMTGRSPSSLVTNETLTHPRPTRGSAFVPLLLLLPLLFLSRLTSARELVKLHGPAVRSSDCAVGVL